MPDVLWLGEEMERLRAAFAADAAGFHAAAEERVAKHELARAQAA